MSALNRLCIRTITHSCAGDLIRDLSEECFILFGVLASDKDFKCDLATFQRFQMFCYNKSAADLSAPCVVKGVPFFEVVTM
jgi:hypothetical protein